MLSRDITKTSLHLIKEKIIKTNVLLNIVCEKNAAISELHSKLDLVCEKYTAKCKEIDSLNEKFASKNKEFYIQSSKLVKLQEEHDQLIFDSNYIQIQHNEANNDSYITIQNLESELIKLNAKVNSLQKEKELFKLTCSNGRVEQFETEREGKLKATIKDFKAKVKTLQEDLMQSQKLHNNCLKELRISIEECKRLDLVFKNYKNHNQKEYSGNCAFCTKNLNPILYKSIPDDQKEKYQRLFNQYEELQLTVDKLKADNIKIAEKYSNSLLETQLRKEQVNVSSQTLEIEFNYRENDKEKNLALPEKIMVKRIDVNEKTVRLRQLKRDKCKLKEDIMKIINEKRVLQTDLKCLSHENRKFVDKYEQMKLERDALILESHLSTSITPTILPKLSEECVIEINAEDFQRLQQNKGVDNILPPNKYDFYEPADDLGLNLSSSESESEKELDSCENIIQKMVKFREILSPLPKTPIPLNNVRVAEDTQITSVRKLDFQSCQRATIVNDVLSPMSSDSLHPSITNGFDNNRTESNNCYQCQNNSRNGMKVITNCESTQTDLLELKTNSESTQTDSLETKTNSDSTQTDFLEQKWNCESTQTDVMELKEDFDGLVEETGVQCEIKTESVHIGCQINISAKDKGVLKLRINKRLKLCRKDDLTLKRALQIIKRANLNVIIKDGNVKQLLKQNNNFKKPLSNRVKEENLEFASAIFHNYLVTMNFENGDLITVENKNNALRNAFNSFLSNKSNHTLRKLFRKFRDLKNAMNIANKTKLSDVVINGVLCDKNRIESSKLVDGDILDVAVKNGNLLQHCRSIKAILDRAENLIGFGDDANMTITKSVTKSIASCKAIKRKLVRGVSNKRDLLIKKKRSNDLRAKFDVEFKETKARNFLGAVPKPIENKDNVSVDSGYTDGSETSEVSKDIENARILRSGVIVKRSRSNSSNSQQKVTLLNKKRKISAREIFGSEDGSDEEEKEVCVSPPHQTKSPNNKKKTNTVLDKMKKVIRTYNPRALSNSNTNNHNNSSSRRKSVEKDEGLSGKESTVSPRKENHQQKTDGKETKRNKNKLCDEDVLVETLKKKETPQIKMIIPEKISQEIILENKEHLLQRFISDIPIIKPIRKNIVKTVFKKPLARRRTSREITYKEKNIPRTNTLLNQNEIREGCSNETESFVLSRNIEECAARSAEEDDGQISEESGGEEEEKYISDAEGLRLLSNLIQNNCEESVVSTVYDKISSIPTRQVSRLIIHVLYKYRSEAAEPSHTPLAPSLSPTYKTLIGFANSLSQGRHTNFFSDVLDQLEAKFLSHSNAKINNNNTVAKKTIIQGVTILSLEQVFRFYVSVCMLKAEVLRLRRFLCDMAYYQKDGFYGLVYSVFTIWPAVLPKNYIDEEQRPLLKENDALLMKVLMFFVYKKRNSEEFMHYRPFLATFAFGFYKYKADDLHIKLIFDQLIQKFTCSDSDILAYALIILLYRITNPEFLNLIRSESFNNVFEAPDEEKLVAKSKLLWLLDRIIPEIKIRRDRKTIDTLASVLDKLKIRVDNDKVKNFIASCSEKLTTK